MNFYDWFDEVELFSTRSERFFNDLDHHVPNSKGANGRMIGWLKSAYEAGYNHRLYKTTDDLK